MRKPFAATRTTETAPAGPTRTGAPPAGPARADTSLADAPSLATAPPRLTLAGDLARPARLAVADLLAWPQHRAEVTFECATDGARRHRFTGPLLHDVLSAAAPGFDAARRKDRLRFLIAVTGADGHRTLLTWAEIDPDFGRAPVLLATTLDDHRLDAAGPQLVVPQDRCGARYVSGVRAIRVDGGYPGTR
ncbi:molybdopterin-dependent oxidoreductase [Streptomyces sp. NPDC058417]|uniref:molybdopterin-dependent oxidoreductase n=1 Tax=unclassified Streptomyces TaxID=2593676 RepID=UPI0036554E0B